MECEICKSKNVKLLKEGNFYEGIFCNECGNGRIINYHPFCCGNQSLIDIRFEQANGVIVQREACRNCFQMIGGAKKKGDGFEQLRLYKQASYVDHQQKRNESHSILHSYITKLSQDFRDKKSKEWWEDYSKYLQTEKWKGKRALVLEREGGVCQGCHYEQAIHVHHLTYDNLGDELLFQLVALCKSCHRKVHPEKSF